MTSTLKLSGLSIAGRDAAPWVTDFLNAAYYKRPGADVADVRLAFTILTTYWWRHGKLHVTDLPAFHRAFGRARLDASGRLERDALLAGGRALLGDWFPGTVSGWGIAFPDEEARAAYDPARRLELAPLGELTPETSADAIFHTYPPVPVADVAATVAAVTTPERWPDYATGLGRFTPLRRGGLDGQTFEIEVVAPGPILQRGYVTVSGPTTDADWLAALEAGLAAQGEPRAVPEGGELLAGIDLTTHAGHFMGAGHNRVLLFTDADGAPFLRAAGTWNPMPWHLDRAYALAGRDAQHAFWGPDPQQSMLAQLAAA